MDDERIICYIDGIETNIDKISGDAQYLEITTEDGNEYRLFECYDDAEESVRDFWDDMATNSTEELCAIVGHEELVSMWMRGMSFDDWLDERINEGVEYHLAHYDHTECTFKSEHEELSVYELAYRTM